MGHVGPSWLPGWIVRREVRLAVSLALGALLLLAAFRGVDLRRLALTIEDVRPHWLVAAVTLDLGVFLAKAFKWRLVIAPLRRLPPSMLLSGLAVGALAGNVLPFRLDEIVRALYLARRSGLSRATALGTIVAERTIDVAMLLGVVVALLGMFSDQEWLLRGTLVLVVVLAGLGTLAWFGARQERGIRSASGRARPWPTALAGWSAGLRSGLAALPRRGRLVLALALGGVEWALTVAYLVCALAAFGVSLSPRWGLLLGAAAYLGFALPSGPAGLGAFELLVKGALSGGLGVDTSRSLGIALAVHVLLVTPISLLGAVVLAREGGGREALRQAWGEGGDEAA